MSVSGLLLRFTGIYVGLLISLVIAFDVLGLTSNSGVNSGALIGAVLGSCSLFGSKNKRFLEAQERKNAILGMWAIDVGLQFLMSVVGGAVTGAQSPFSSLLVAVAFVGVLHGLVIYFMVGVAGKQYEKQRAKVA